MFQVSDHEGQQLLFWAMIGHLFKNLSQMES